MLVNELAKKLEVSPETIRYYTRIGLLKADKAANGYHQYALKQQHILRFCVQARQLGFSIEDLNSIISMSELADTPCPGVRDIVSRNLINAKRRHTEAGRLLRQMRKASKRWSGAGERIPDGREVTLLIEVCNEAAS